MALLEALLFAAPGPLSLEVLSAASGLSEEEAAALLARLGEHYAREGHGIQLVAVAGGYQLRTRPEYHQHLVRLAGTEKRHGLSRAALETLGIVAYLQPVTRAEVERLRGVRSDHVLSVLLERGLIAEVGRASSPGRPALYGTTPFFLEFFGLKSLADLPEVPELSAWKEGRDSQGTGGEE